MACLFIQMSVSLVGFIEDGGGGMERFAGYQTFDELLTSTVRGIDGTVFGRKSYELVAPYWPTAGKTAATPRSPTRSRS